MLIETDRLRLRPLTPADLPTLVRFRANDEVSRYIGGAAKQAPAMVEQRLGFYLSCHERYGYGMCAIHTKTDDVMVGWGGIQPLEDSGEVEVGYGFDQPFWGHGYATETAAASLRYGFEQAQLARIVAVTVPENTASRHVLEKLGMKYEGERHHYGISCAYYALTRAEFTPRTGFYAVHDA